MYVCTEGWLKRFCTKVVYNFLLKNEKKSVCTLLCGQEFCMS